MTVYINNKPVDFADVSTVQHAIESQQLHEQRGIAVAVNNAVIPKANWNEHRLSNNDKITIIKATQGG